jgi:chromosome segregation ATPase
MSNTMSNNNEADKPFVVQERTPRGNPVIVGLLSAGLAIALAGDGYLILRSNNLDQHVAQLQSNTQDQMSKLTDATTTLLDQRLRAMGSDVQSANETASEAVKQARTEIQRQSARLSRRLDDQQKEVSGELVELKGATSTANSKLEEVSSDVNGVKTDVNGVKSDVSGVRTEVASTKSQVEKDGAQLRQVMGDMGVMSGLIATNGKDLQALRELGERNYFEFDLSKGQLTKKVGDITISLKKADPKHNRYTVDVLADDKRIEKRDKTINEPVQLYIAESRQPYEVVVNQIKKDEVIGYLSTPKVKIARR